MGVNMKKFLFLISCLVLFGFAGCKKDAEVEKQNYSITITNICEEDILFKRLKLRLLFKLIFRSFVSS